MSSISDIDSTSSDEDNGLYCSTPWKCDLACNHSDEDSTVTEDYNSISDGSDDSESYPKKVFICAYKNENQSNKIIICNATEITTYRRKYSLLKPKTITNVNNIWGNVKVQIPSFGQIPLGQYATELKLELPVKSLKSKKKCFKKPSDAVQKKIILDSCQIDTKMINANYTLKDKESLVKINPKPTICNNKTNQNSHQVKKINTSETNVKEINKNAQIKNSENKNQSVKKTENINTSEIKVREANIIIQNKNSEKTSKTLKKPENGIINDKQTKAAPINKNITPNTIINNKNIKINLNDKNINNPSPEFKKPSSTIIKSNLNDASKTSSSNKNVKNVPGESKLYNNIKNSKIKIENQSLKQEFTQLTAEQKSLKKKLKKLKQKEKKLENDKSNCNSRDASDSSRTTTPRSSKSKNNHKTDKNEEIEVDEKIENQSKKNSEEEISSDDDMDFLTDAENMPTFIAETLKRKEKNKATKQSNKSASKSLEKEINHDDKEDDTFILHTRKKNKKSLAIPRQNYSLHSRKLGEEAVDMILENNLKGGLDKIQEAINYDHSDHRHYLNRCYCYLRMNKNDIALSDAQYVIQTSTNIGHLFMGNLRAGQASLALKKYEDAEKYLKEAVRINPTNHHAKRELMRFEIRKIVNIGYSERDALIALQTYPSALEAINYLVENNIISHESKIKNDYDPFDCDEDLIYASDEEEKPSNIEILNCILNYVPGKTKLLHMITKPSNPALIQPSASSKKDINFSENNKKINGTATGNITEKAIWVGNLTSNITEAMLKQKFKQFGHVISVYRPCNELYAFINFQKSEDVNNVLMTTCHEIAGVKLAVRSAIRNK